MNPDDIWEMEYVGDVRISPEGSKTAIVVVSLDREKNEYRSRIELISGGKIKGFTRGDHRDSKPRWSRDGSTLAFVSHREEKGSQLYVIPADGGEPKRLAEFPEEIEDAAFSPDGKQIAFLARDQSESYKIEKPKDQPPRKIDRLVYRLDSVGWTIDRPRHLFVVDADGKREPVQITSGPNDTSGLSWSPDSKKLAFVSARHDTWDLDRKTDLYVVSAEGGEPERITKTDSAHHSPSWSPDGSMIAVAWSPAPMDSPHHAQIAVVELATSKRRVLTESLDRQCLPFGSMREPAWEGNDIYFTVEDAGRTHIYRVSSDGNEKPEPVVTGVLQVTAFDVTSETMAFVATEPALLPDLFVMDGDNPGRITDYGDKFASKTHLAKPTRFTAISADGSEVEAWCMKPTEFTEGKKYPMLLNIHGGPFTQYGDRFFDEFQVYAGAGYAVVYSNPRGSSGYSEAWGRAIRGPKAPDPGSGWGGVDYEDLMAVTDEALKRFDFIDGDRLGVMGGSYGGFMTSWMIGHTDRFKAACSERAVNNHLTMCWTSDIGPFFKSYFGPSYLEDPEEYLRMSPIRYVESIHTPVLILHSENDLRCPISQAEELFTALRILEREVEFFRFPGESHELSRAGSPKHREERFRILLDWFDRHLGARPADHKEKPEAAGR